MEPATATATVLPPQTASNWFAINQASEHEAEIRIYDVIGSFGISAAQFVADLDRITASNITVRINTPGGEITEGTAIYNALRDHPARITSQIEGVAASAGSWIALAGNNVRIADNAYFMIHEAQGGVMGKAGDMTSYAATLEKMNDTIAGMYAKKTGKTRKYWRDKMTDETWFTAAEAKAEGLVDSIYQSGATNSSVNGAFDFKMYNKTPDVVKTMWGISPQSTPDTSPSGEPGPVASLSEGTQPMADTLTVPAAQPTVAATQASTSSDQIAGFNAQAVEGYINKGRQVGFNEGTKAAIDTLKSIMELTPGRPDLALNAFLAGQTPGTAKLIFDAAEQSRRDAEVRSNQLALENAKLQAVIATGGHPGVAASLNTPQQEMPNDMEPEERAKMEYLSDPVLRAKYNEKQYVLYRANQLKGNVKSFAR